MKPDKVCFKRTSDFTVSNNVLTVAQRALKFQENRIYRFLITTSLPNFSQIYSQEVDIIVKNFDQMLAVQLACSPAFTCFKYGDVLVINPNSQIILDGSCTSGCESAASTGVSYAWRLYAAVRTGSKITWSPIVMPNNSFVSGQEKNKIVLLPSFFAAYQEISFQWKARYWHG